MTPPAWPRATKRLWYRLAAGIVRWLVIEPTGHVTVTGKENVPKCGPVLIAPVHLSHFDPPLMGSTCPREVRFMAKEELFKNPFFGALIRTLGAFPVKRGEGDTAAIRQSLEWLKEGRAVLVFPEGGRGDGVTLQAMLPGVAVLARRSGAPVVPVGIYGTHIVWPKASKKIRRSPIRVSFGKPFTYDDVVGEGGNDRDRFLDHVAASLVEECRRVGLELRTAAREPDRTTSPPPRTQS